MTWLIHVIGYLCLYTGFFLLFSPILAFLDVVPILSKLLGVGAFLIAFVLSWACSHYHVRLVAYVSAALCGLDDRHCCGYHHFVSASRRS
eukprot:SAG31_NODE_8209_length_1496_cov_1.281317_2_plen_90_part_00